VDSAVLFDITGNQNGRSGKTWLYTDFGVMDIQR